MGGDQHLHSPAHCPVIRNEQAFADSLRNFASWLGDVVPGASDIDFMCERNGFVLVLEGKPWTNGVNVPYGQHKALKALSEKPGFTLYLVGESGSDRVYVMRYNASNKPLVTRQDGKPYAWHPADRFIPSTKDGVKDLVGAWWEAAASPSAA